MFLPTAQSVLPYTLQQWTGPICSDINRTSLQFCMCGRNLSAILLSKIRQNTFSLCQKNPAGVFPTLSTNRIFLVDLQNHVVVIPDFLSTKMCLHHQSEESQILCPSNGALSKLKNCIYSFYAPHSGFSKKNRISSGRDLLRHRSPGEKLCVDPLLGLGTFSDTVNLALPQWTHFDMVFNRAMVIFDTGFVSDSSKSNMSTKCRSLRCSNFWSRFIDYNVT